MIHETCQPQQRAHHTTPPPIESLHLLFLAPQHTVYYKTNTATMNDAELTGKMTIKCCIISNITTLTLVPPPSQCVVNYNCVSLWLTEDPLYPCPETTHSPSRT